MRHGNFDTEKGLCNLFLCENFLLLKEITVQQWLNYCWIPSVVRSCQFGIAGAVTRGAAGWGTARRAWPPRASRRVGPTHLPPLVLI